MSSDARQLQDLVAGAAAGASPDAPGTERRQGQADPRPEPAERRQRRAGDPRIRQVRSFLQQAESESFDLPKLVASALRGRGKVLLITGTLIGILIAMMMKSVIAVSYQSTSLVRLSGRDQKILYNDTDDSRLRLFDSFVNVESNFISSRPVLDRALQDLKDRQVKAIPLSAAQLESAVEVKAQKGLVTVSVLNKKPDVASALVNAVVQAYIDLRNEKNAERQKFRERELNAQVQGQRERLNEINDRIAAVTKSYGEDTMSKMQAARVTQLEALETRIEDLRRSQSPVTSLLGSAIAAPIDREVKRLMVSDNALSSINFEFEKRKAELEVMRTRYTIKNPKLAAAELEVKVLEKAVHTRIASLGELGQINSASENNSAALTPEQAEAQLKNLEDQHKKLATEVDELNKRMQELALLKNERTQAGTLLDDAARALEQIRIESRSSTGSAEVVEPGVTPSGPYKDKRKQLTIIGFFGGYGVSFALLVLGQLVFPRMRFAEDAKKLGAAAVYVGNLPAGVLAGGTGKAAHDLRNSLQLVLRQDDRPGGKVIAVAGLHAGAPGPQAASTLAASFAEAGINAVLVDGDLLEPSLTRTLGFAEMEGLREWIAGSGATPVAGQLLRGFTVLGSGQSERVSDSSLSLEHVRTLFTQLREKHDLAIVHCGHAENRLAARLFVAQADLSLGVIEAGCDANAVRSSILQLATVLTRPIQVAFCSRREEDKPAPLPKDPRQWPSWSRRRWARQIEGAEMSWRQAGYFARRLRKYFRKRKTSA